MIWRQVSAQNSLSTEAGVSREKVIRSAVLKDHCLAISEVDTLLSTRFL